MSNQGASVRLPPAPPGSPLTRYRCSLALFILLFLSPPLKRSREAETSSVTERPACAGLPLAIRLGPPIFGHPCGQYPPCVSQVSIVLRNCSSKLIQVEDMVFVATKPVNCVGGERERTRFFTKSFEIPPDGLYETSLTQIPDTPIGGRLEIALSQGHGVRVIRLEAPIPPSPYLKDAFAACEACRGKWGNVTGTGYPSCQCRTRDAGAVCRRSSECEGACVHPVADDVFVEKKALGQRSLPPEYLMIDGQVALAKGRCSVFVPPLADVVKEQEELLSETP